MHVKILAAVSFAALLAPAPGRVLYVYRDLLDGGPRSPLGSTIYDDRCGAGNGPFTPLAVGDAGATPEIAREIDAAGVPALIDRGLRRAMAALPGAVVTICAFAGQNIGGLPYLGGVGGVSLGQGHIKLFLHPAPKGLARIEYTVAHEYHHEVERLLGPQRDFRPLSRVIREGKADNFAVLLYPHLRPPHTQPLSDAELRTAWRDLMAYEENPAGFGSEFMIGRFPGGTRWPGYRLGFEMVEAYVRTVAQPPTVWIKATAKEVATAFIRSKRFVSLFGSRD
jgi:Predicted Zn-dependent protease (DUF2268)